MPERRVDESAVVRISGARMGVPVEEAAGEAHLDDRNLPLLLQPADLVGHHQQQLALAGLVRFAHLRQRARSPVQRLRRLARPRSVIFTGSSHIDRCSRELAPLVHLNRRRAVSVPLRQSLRTGPRPEKSDRQQTHCHGTPLCQETAGSGVLGWALAGPGSDFSEVPAMGIGSAALDCRVAPMCPPGPVPGAFASAIMRL